MADRSERAERAGPSDPEAELPMFPLGSVLFPHMPLLLNIFEPRYRRLLADCIPADPPEFGVVLIERGAEVGGGDTRFGLGTTARITQAAELAPGLFRVAAVGSRRFRVTGWLPDDPYPRASVEVLGNPPEVSQPPEPSPPPRDEAERLVRRALTLRSELADPTLWSPSVLLDDDPTVAAWQLAAIAPLGELSQLELLGLDKPADRLSRLVELVSEECEVLAFRLAGG